MRYDYQCDSCLNLQEEWHLYQEKPNVICHKCSGKCIKLISCPSGFIGANTRMYDFVDFNTTGSPVVINSKKQWNNHLKAHGLNDDVKNDPLTKSDVENMQRKEVRKKEDNRRKIRENVIDVVRNTPTSKLRERAKKVIKKGV